MWWRNYSQTQKLRICLGQMPKVLYSLIKVKTKTIYFYFIKQKLFAYSLHHQCYWTEMKFYFSHFRKTGYYGDLNQYQTNTIPLIDIMIPYQFVFYLHNHYWLLSVKVSLEAKDLTKQS